MGAYGWDALLSTYDKETDTVAINIEGAQVNLPVAEWRKMVNEINGQMVGIHAPAGEQVKRRVRVRPLPMAEGDNEADAPYSFQVIGANGEPQDRSEPYKGKWNAKRGASDLLGVSIHEIEWV